MVASMVGKLLTQSVIILSERSKLEVPKMTRPPLSEYPAKDVLEEND